MEQTGTELVSFFVIENTGQEVLVSPVLGTRPTFIIGSDTRNALQLDDPSVEPAHAMVKRKDGETFIQPRFPNLEVVVNGKRVKAATRLKPGDVVGIGETRLRFDEEERRVQIPVGKPAVQVNRPTTALIPAQATSLTQIAPRPAEIIPMGERTIYRPEKAKESQGTSYLRLMGIVAIVVVLVAGGYFAYTTLNVSAAQGRPVDYAFDDGNVSVLLFTINGCQPCVEQEALVAHVLEDYRGDAYRQFFNLSHPGNQYLIEKYQLVSALTVIVLDDLGEVFVSFGGGTDEETLRQVLDLALEESANN